MSHPAGTSPPAPLAFGLTVAKALLRLPNRAVPYRFQRILLAPALNRALQAPLEQGNFDFLAGRTVRLRVDDLAVDWLLTLRGGRFEAVDRQAPEDVCIAGPSSAFALLASRRADPDTLFFQRRIRVEGDTELGLGVKNTLDGMDWDELPAPLRRLLRLLP